MSNKCPICFNSSQFNFESSYFNIWQCENKNCRHLFAVGTKKQQGVVVNRESKEQIYRERNKHLIEYWGGAGFINDNSTILDVGSGEGHILKSLFAKHDSLIIHSVEPDQKSRDKLKTIHGNIYVYDSMAEMPTDIKVDAVILIEVIEHVDDPVTFMSEIKDKLKSGGKLFITTPAGDVTDNWFSKIVKSYIPRFKVGKQGLGAYKSEFHIHFFTEDSLQLCAEKAGFEEIKFEYIDQLYPRDSYQGLGALKRVLKTKLKLALRGRSHLTGFAENKG